MTERELAEYNVGENLDQLMNLDPRGYGVCRVLYPASRNYAGGPVAMHAAKKLYELLDSKKSDTIVYVMTGFILRPHLQPETDGITGALLFVRALIRAFGITPVIVIPEKNKPAVLDCAPVLGLHVYDDIETACTLPLSFAYTIISADQAEADVQISKLLAGTKPAAVFSTETAGANINGEYHNAVGVNMTEIEAKQDNLFSGMQKLGVPVFAVGDLGNEIGMGAIEPHIRQFIPYTGGEGAYSECRCGCNTGIASSTKADFLVTATVSDWGVYAVIAALAFILKDISIMHDAETEEMVLRQCCRSGMVDMTGSLLPAIDGFSVEMEKQIVALMRSTVEYALNYSSETWFKAVLEKGFYEPAVFRNY
jgi:hypothetical protein